MRSSLGLQSTLNHLSSTTWLWSTDTLTTNLNLSVAHNMTSLRSMRTPGWDAMTDFSFISSIQPGLDKDSALCFLFFSLSCFLSFSPSLFSKWRTWIIHFIIHLFNQLDNISNWMKTIREQIQTPLSVWQRKFLFLRKKQFLRKKKTGDCDSNALDIFTSKGHLKSHSRVGKLYYIGHLYFLHCTFQYFNSKCILCESWALMWVVK